MSDRLLTFTAAFVSGAVLLAFEILSSRLLGPFIGSSIFTWSNIIAMVLLGLAVGNIAAGLAISEKRPSAVSIEFLLAISALLISIIGNFSFSICSFIQSWDLNNWLSSMLMAFFATFGVATLLGMIPPILYSIAILDLKNVGKIAATLSAINTVGCLAGALLLNFVFLFYLELSVYQTLAAFSLLLVAPVTIALISRAHERKTAIILIALVISTLAFVFRNWNYHTPILKKDARLLKELHSPYNSVQVIDHTMPFPDGTTGAVRALAIAGTKTVHSFVTTDSNLRSVGFYPELTRLAWAFNRNIHDVLFLGMGAGLSARDLARSNLNAKIDLVEIDRGLLPIAKDFFGFIDSPDLSLYFTDARLFFRESPENRLYDFIFEDLFGLNGSPPEHVFSLEYFQAIRKALRDDGVFMLNVIGEVKDFENVGITNSMVSTLQTAFPDWQVYSILPGKVFRADSEIPARFQNVIVFVSQQSLNFDGLNEFLAAANYGSYMDFSKETFSRAEIHPTGGTLFTDARSLLPFLAQQANQQHESAAR